jgi:hypothetical protein
MNSTKIPGNRQAGEALPDRRDRHHPDSWQAADDLRRRGHVGLIDPSRRRAGLWHITLFNWNDGIGPAVRLIGEPRPITVVPDLR